MNIQGDVHDAAARDIHIHQGRVCWHCVLLTLVIFVQAISHVFAADLSAAQARAKALAMKAQLDAVAPELAAVASSLDNARYQHRVWRPMMEALRMWPEDHLKNKAIFRYGDCKMAALDAAGLGVLSDRNAAWAVRKLGQFEEDRANCADALAHQ